jgi:anhydro-N-acetylmuramic acid kinase
MLYIGLMSGTSLDGIDAAIIETDGAKVQKFGNTLYKAYDENFKEKLRRLISGKECDWLVIEKELTELHAEIVNELLQKSSLEPKNIKAIGFHGQTIIHRPNESITWQIGNGALLSELTKIDVVTDFRRRDVANGGQGAPLVPIFHKAIMASEEMPCAVLNLGGVSNITYIDNESIVAFDCGPANAIINDACMKYFDQAFDNAGELAAQGSCLNNEYILKWLEHPYFKKEPPKSLDRNEFKKLVESIEIEDNKYNIITTLTKFAAESVVYAVTNTLPSLPKIIYVAGGGVKNNILMKFIRESLPFPVKLASLNEKGLDPDFTEAQAFAYLAARALKGLPISFPTTTGSRQALCGGAYYRL